MKTYELLDFGYSQMVKRTTSAGEVTWIPLDVQNRDYDEYLRYTAWVEADNDPNEFWAEEVI